MKINGNSLKLKGNQWKSQENSLKSKKIFKNLRNYLKINENHENHNFCNTFHAKSMKILQHNLLKNIKIDEKSMQIHGNSLKTLENPWKATENPFKS